MADRLLKIQHVFKFIFIIQLELIHASILGNRFSCDCRMGWMHTLLNETPNEHIRNVLEELTCFWNDSEHVEGGVAPLTSQSHAHRPHHSRTHLHHSEEPNEVGDSYDEDYEEDAGSQRHLMDIPVETLPCPEAVKVATDSPLTADTRHEGMPSSAWSQPSFWATPLLSLLLRAMATWTLPSSLQLAERRDWRVDWLTCT